MNNAPALAVEALARINHVRETFGLEDGWMDWGLQRAVYPPGNVRLSHLASVIGAIEIFGPHLPHICATCYLGWVDAGGEGPAPKCCEAWEAAAFESHEIAKRFR